MIVIVFDLSEKIDNFLKTKPSVTEVMFSYYLNFIPYFVNLFVYLFTFISVIFFTSKMAYNTEIIAILSNGSVSPDCSGPISWLPHSWR